MSRFKTIGRIIYYLQQLEDEDLETILGDLKEHFGDAVSTSDESIQNAASEALSIDNEEKLEGDDVQEEIERSSTETLELEETLQEDSEDESSSEVKTVLNNDEASAKDYEHTVAT